MLGRQFFFFHINVLARLRVRACVRVLQFLVWLQFSWKTQVKVFFLYLRNVGFSSVATFIHRWLLLVQHMLHETAFSHSEHFCLFMNVLIFMALLLHIVHQNNSASFTHSWYRSEYYEFLLHSWQCIWNSLAVTESTVLYLYVCLNMQQSSVTDPSEERPAAVTKDNEDKVGRFGSFFEKLCSTFHICGQKTAVAYVCQ